jgi:phosphatidylethanolamine/phosphatidyl-N-methylethanolamine N-methyltransferase
MPNCGISGDKYQNDLIRLTKCAAHRLAHVEALSVMDAQQLALAEAFFDVVVAQDVITTVPDPERALDEIARVTRPGARSSWSTTSARRRACGAYSSRALHRSPAGSAGARNFAGGASPMGRAGQPDVRLLERRPMPPLGHFSVIRFARMPRQAPPAGTRGAGDGKLA